MGAAENHVNFLDAVRDNLIKKLDSESVQGLSGEDWEEIVFNECLTTRDERQEDWNLVRTKPTEFPDIVLDDVFGIEVKSTKGDQWHSLGNSINESKRIPSVEAIYFLFGKLGGDFGVSVKPYEACLKSIATTHYPRYVVDMQLQDGTSIFQRLGLTYDHYRNLEPEHRIRLIKQFLRDNFDEGESLWWVDETTTPTISTFNRLPLETKTQFRLLAMARCPEIFGSAGNGKKYDRVAGLLLTEMRAVSGNIRDFFSAGGQEIIALKSGDRVQVPQVFAQLHKYAAEISEIILTLDQHELAIDWQIPKISEDPLSDYAEVLNQHPNSNSEITSPGQIFLDGLSRIY